MSIRAFLETEKKKKKRMHLAIILVRSSCFFLCYCTMAQALYASSKNKGPILDVLRPRIDAYRQDAATIVNVLEIASGTGEHAAFFGSNIPGLLWQPTEPQLEMHSSITAWSADAGIPADPAEVSAKQSVTLAPVVLDVLSADVAALPLLPSHTHGNADLMVCINMIHISPWSCTEALFRIAGTCLKPGGLLLTYGPYRVNGDMVDSNKAFDESLKGRDPAWGIRDKEAVAAVAAVEGIALDETVEMPSNNLCLVFRKT